MPASEQRIAVLGAGTMGHGIALALAQSGYAVCLHDSSEAALRKGLDQIDRILKEGVERGKVSPADAESARGRLTSSRICSQAVAEAFLVIEAIVEKLEAKQELFRAVESLTPRGALLASNTSSLPIGRIAAALIDPGRLIGLHFFNPVHAMKLVEVVVHERTRDEVKSQALEVVARLGKEAIVVRDSPGFASSRLGVVLGLEAMRMLEQDVASAADIDKAMELGYKHPIGPLKLTDLVGLDVRLAIAEALHQALRGEQYRPPEILRRKVAAGELGKKSGRGFYEWPQT